MSAEDNAGAGHQAGDFDELFDPAPRALSPADIAAVLSNPDVTAAIRSAIDSAVTAKLAQMPAAPVQGADMTMLTEFTRTITDLVNQGVNEADKKIPPDVLAKREAGRKRMIGLIRQRNAAIRANPRDVGEWPEYRIIDMTFLHESWIMPAVLDPVSKTMVPNHIHFDGVPNRVMMPVNQYARAIHDAFMEWTGGNGVAGVEPEDLAISPNGIIFRGQMSNEIRTRNKIGTVSNTVYDEDPDVTDYKQRAGVTGAINPEASHVQILGNLHRPAVQSSSADALMTRDTRFSVPGGLA